MSTSFANLPDIQSQADCLFLSETVGPPARSAVMGSSWTARQICAVFARCFYRTHHTILEGWGDEPLYCPGDQGSPARIVYRLDYVRSALHEVAHWCVAGPGRRRLPDYGYWYSPDNRDIDQQRAFFAVEARPQALERVFCEALAVPFSPSIDNPGPPPPASDVQLFEQRLDQAYERFSCEGLTERAARFHDGLVDLARGA